MFKSIVEDAKREFSYGNMITQLIIINTVFFILINLVKLFFTVSGGFDHSQDFDQFLVYLQLSSDLVFNLKHPWVIITHMFVHTGFFHFLFNMLFLYWFGRIVGDFLGDNRILPIYLVSGLLGALVYLISAPLIHPGLSHAHGASAAVMGIVVASGAIAPNYILRVLFIGDVRLKYIVIVLLFLDLIGIANLSNTGGHFAHLGGAVMGWFFVHMLKQGTDLSKPVNGFLSKVKALFSPSQKREQKKVYVKYKETSSSRASKKKAKQPSPDFQEKLDTILDKIKASGYDNLTEEEKEFLFQASKKQ